jgi:dimethylargininase
VNAQDNPSQLVSSNPAKSPARKGLALMRQIPDSINQCCLEFQPRREIDVGIARQQQSAYSAAIASAGYEVHMLPTSDLHADCAFVEDSAIVLDKLALLLRMGRPERRGESDAVRQFFQNREHFEIVEMPAPGTADGGDVMRVGRQLFVGLSTRTNWQGFQFIRGVAETIGFRTLPVEVRGALHLKSVCTFVGDDTIVASMEHLGQGSEHLRCFRTVETMPGEEAAANVVRANDVLFVPLGFPRTSQQLSRQGWSPVHIDISEIQKAEAGLSCLSILSP